ncbi:MAG TPA: hypothetical protein VFS67_04020 [Polyangiaceae bacterium]|nr:hypothetical protein [Polyangiaceae bacterium]
MLGYNLDFPGDWTDLPPFIDLMQNSRAPEGKCSEDDPNCSGRAHLDLAPDGWPRSLRYRDDPSRSYASIGIVISSGSHRSDFGRRFVVTWEGSGRLEIDNGKEVRSVQGAKRLSFTLQPDATYLRLTEIDPERRGDYLRNIRVFRADQEQLLDQGEIFNPEMLDFLAPFRSLRFMDWMASNEYGVCSGGARAGDECYAVTDDDCGGGRCVMPGHWGERPTESVPSRLASGQYLDLKRPELGTKVGGYPLETLVALANRVPADPHFNLPVEADDEYVKRFAEYLKQNLDPRLVASVEYGNEVWNWGFPQAEYANAKGQKLWPDEGSAWVQYAAGRTASACRIIKQVFGSGSDRVRCLLSPQTGWRELAPKVLDCPDWAADHPSDGPCYEAVDAVNITGYFSGCLPSNEDVIADWLQGGERKALERAFEQLEHGGLIPGCSGEEEDNLDYTIEGYRYFAKLAQARGLGLQVYESGTHFNYEGDDREVHDLLVQMTRDERMYDLYLKNFEGFSAAGGEIMNVWGWVGPDDMWANADTPTDRAHPKYRAILDFAGAPR